MTPFELRIRSMNELAEAGVGDMSGWEQKQAYLDGFIGVPMEDVILWHKLLPKQAFLGGFLRKEPRLTPEMAMAMQEPDMRFGGGASDSGKGVLQGAAVGGAAWGGWKLLNKLISATGGKKNLWELAKRVPKPLALAMLAGGLIGSTKPLWGNVSSTLYPE